MPTRAEIERRLKAMSDASQELADLIDRRIEQMQAEAARLEAEMYELTRDEVLKLSTNPDGTLKNTASNIAGVARIDTVFRRLSRDLDKLMRDFADWLFEITDGVVDVYRAGSFRVTDNQVQALTTKIESVIGITGNKLTPGGYLDRLGIADPVRQRLKDFMLGAIAGKTPLDGLVGGLRGLVKGSQGVDGAMTSYLRQYAYDTFNQVREIANQEQAERLDLKYFVYQGSIITESRAFCRKRAGKAFSVEETKTWKDDPTLIEPKTKASYNPLIERGRYNCRHWLTYISKEMYDIIKQNENA